MIKPHPAEAIMSHPPLTVKVFIHRVTVVINILHIYVLAVAGKKKNKNKSRVPIRTMVAWFPCPVFFFFSS